MGTRKEYLEHLYVSIVPFNVAVNIGTANTHMLTGTAPTYSNGFSWSGCVEAREGCYHLTDHGPMTAGFRRYFWPSTYSTSLTAAGGKCTDNQDYDQSPNTSGANTSAWGATTGPPSSVVAQNDFIVDANRYAPTTGRGEQDAVVGPQHDVPDDVYPAAHAEEGRDQPYLVAQPPQIAKITDLPFAFGTIIPTGLQGGWYTLSPHFRAGTATGGLGWKQVEPPPAADEPALPAPPLDYRRRTWTR